MKKLSSMILFACILLAAYQVSGQNVSNSADSNFTTWQNRPLGPVDCGEILPTNDKTRSKGTKILSILTDTSCQEKFNIGDSYDQSGDYIKADSVLREYLETCYDSDDALEALGDLGDADGHAYPTPAGGANYINFLKSILWLRQMYPNWYCDIANQIYGTYVAINDGRDLNAALAVLRYLDSSGRCNFDGDENTYLAERHQVWLDTVKSLHKGDTTDFPEDTTIPTIDELGLGILRGPPAGIQSAPPSPTGISDLTASENPFSKETTISFETGEYAYISFQVFDVLGRIVQGDYKGSVQQPGTYSFTVDGTNLADGVYYARITTPTGITRTLKLVKE